MTVAEPLRPSCDAADSSRTRDVRMAVISDSPPERNGVGSYYADLVTQLGGRINEAELICPRGNRAHWHRYLVPPLPGDSTQKVWLPRPVKLWKHLSRLRPDVIVVPTPGPYGIAGMIAARFLGVPLIVGFHTNYEALASIYWTRAFGRLCRWYLTRCNRILFRRAALVLANSDDMLKQARTLGGSRFELIGTSIPGEFLSRPLAPLSAESCRVVFAGRLAQEKNLPAVLEAARALPGLQFSIAGDGPMREAVEVAENALPNLAYLGWLSREQLVDTLDDHDVLLLPSHVESFGTVALEGMARARSVIVSQACGIAEWEDLSRGLFLIGRDETVTEALSRVCSLPLAERQRRADAAHRAATRLNNWNVDNWIGHIGKLV